MKQRKKIGELAVSKGWLTEKEIEKILSLQSKRKKEKKLFGQLLVEQGICSEAMLNSLLSEQNNTTAYLFQTLENQQEPFDFGDYKILKLIGKGGMGAIYQATNACGKIVAIKVIKWLNFDEKSKKRFLRENKILANIASVKHPNIVEVYEYGSIAGVDFYAMEFIEGQTLDKAIRQKDFSHEDWLKKIIPLFEGIESIHKMGIIHRDLKPANVMLSSKGRLILIDFGLSKNVKHEETTIITTQIIGSPSYMAPEQTMPEGKHDTRTDIWALGIILYQVLTKKHPFKEATTKKLVYAIQYSKQKSIQEHKKDLPWQLNAICNCALQKKKNHRYQYVQEMVEDIKSFLNGNGILAAEFKSIHSFKYCFSYLIFGYVAFLVFMAIGLYLYYETKIVSMAFFISSFFALMWIYLKTGYTITINEEGLIQTTRISTKKVFDWNKVKRLERVKLQLLVETEEKTWISPPKHLLAPTTFESFMFHRVKDSELEFEIAKILLQGGDAIKVAQRFNLSLKLANQMIQKVAGKMHSAAIHAIQNEEEIF